MADKPSEPVTLRLADREFLIACPPEEREDLQDAAVYLDRKMRDLRANAKTSGFERLAVLAAVSVAHELITLRRAQTSERQQLDDGLGGLRRRVQSALDEATRQA